MFRNLVRVLAAASSLLIVAAAQGSTPLFSETFTASNTCSGSVQSSTYSLSPPSYPITIVGSDLTASGPTGAEGVSVVGVGGIGNLINLFGVGPDPVQRTAFFPAGTGVVMPSAVALQLNFQCTTGSWGADFTVWYSVP